MQPPGVLFLFLLFLTISHATGKEWDKSNFPNPTGKDFKQCNMKVQSLLCDPDSVFSEAERFRLNYELHQLEPQTQKDQEITFCGKKGVTVVFAIAKHFRGGSEEAVKGVANEMLKNLDKPCQKAIVIAMSTQNQTFWMAKDDKVPISATNFTNLSIAVKQLFRFGNYQMGLHKIFKAFSKRTSPVLPSDSPKPKSPSDSSDKKPKSKPKSGSGFPKISVVLIVTFVLIIILLLLCVGCCVYFCCFRNKDRQPVGHADIEGGSFGGEKTDGMGGSAAASSIMNMIRNKTRGSGGDPTDAGYTPGVPIKHGENHNGKGFQVKDEGGASY